MSEFADVSSENSSQTLSSRSYEELSPVTSANSLIFVSSLPFDFLPDSVDVFGMTPLRKLSTMLKSFMNS